MTMALSMTVLIAIAGTFHEYSADVEIMERRRGPTIKESCYRDYQDCTDTPRITE